MNCMACGEDRAAASSLLQGLAACGDDSHAEVRLGTLMKRQALDKFMPAPYEFEVTLMTRDGRVKSGKQTMLLPHEVFGRLGTEAPQVFEQIFGGPQQLEAFWQSMLNTCPEQHDDAADPVAAMRRQWHRDWVRGHPAGPGASPDAMRVCVPIGMHGDAGDMHTQEKIMILTWGGLAVRGTTLDTRLLAGAIRDSTMLKPTHGRHELQPTLFQVLRVLVWSLQCMAEGKYPVQDHAGNALDAGRAAMGGMPLTRRQHRAAWCELRGDWEFLKYALGLHRHYGADEVCHLCQAVKPRSGRPAAMHMTRVLRRGELRQTLRDNTTFCTEAYEQGVPASPLLEIPGFEVWRCSFDCMHTLDLGILQVIIPCALQELAGGKVPGGVIGREKPRRPVSTGYPFHGASAAERALAATASYRRWADSAGIRARPKHGITAAWINKTRPKISQVHCKAAALRAMLPWVLRECAARARDSPYAALRAALFRELCALELVWAKAGRFLSPDEAAKAANHGERAMLALVTLAARHKRWRVIPKVHALTHLVYDACELNPRSSHCYQDEDMVGRVKRIYAQCHGRTGPARVLERYRLGACIKVCRRQRAAAMQLPAPAAKARGRRPRIDAVIFRPRGSRATR